jgi:hypothetical protein
MSISQRTLATSAFFLGLLSSPPAVFSQDRPLEKSKELPKEIVSAWVDAGGEWGGIQTNDFGFVRFVLAKQLTGNEIPAFSFRKAPKRRLSELPPIEQPFGLWLQAGWINSDTLTDLAAMKQLQALHLGYMALTPEKAKLLAASETIRALDLQQAVFESGVLKELAALKSLRSLDASNTYMRDAQLSELADLTHLKCFRMTYTKATADGIKELAAIKELEALDLSCSAVSDESLSGITGLKQLKKLNLQQTAVSDAAVKSLVELKELESLDVFDSKITSQGVREIRKSLPKIKIQF